MAVEDRLDFQDIVPEPTWGQRYFPTFLKLVGYEQPQIRQEYPSVVKVQMPRIPWVPENNRTSLGFFFDRLEEILGRIHFEPEEEKKMKLYMDSSSYQNLFDSVPYREGAGMFESAIFAVEALSFCAEDRLKGYRITSVGTGFDRGELTMRIKRAD